MKKKLIANRIVSCVLAIVMVAVLFPNVVKAETVDYTDLINARESFSITGANGLTYNVYYLALDGGISYFFQWCVYNDVDELNSALIAYSTSSTCQTLTNTANTTMANALGVVTGGSSTLLTSAIDTLNAGTLSDHVSLDSEGNTVYDATAIDAIKEAVYDVYYTSIGMSSIDINYDENYSDAFNLVDSYVDETDWTSTLNDMNDNDYIILEYGYYPSGNFVGISNDDILSLVKVDKDILTLNWNDDNLEVGTNYNIYNYSMNYLYSDSYYISGLKYFNGESIYISRYNANSNIYITPSYKEKVRIYSNKYTSIYYFNDYSSAYNYYIGDQNDYITTQFSNAVDSLTFAINDSTEDLTSKMDEIIEAINDEKKDCLTADDLQDLIDDNFEDVLGDIKDEAEETNDNLKDILKYLKKMDDNIDDMFDDLETALKKVMNNNTDDLIDQLDIMNDNLESLVYTTTEIASNTDNADDVASSNVISVINNNYSQMVNTSKTKFPLSIPWDMGLVLAVFSADPEPPVLDITLDFPFFATLGIEPYVFHMDMSNFSVLSVTSRSLLSIVFIWKLIGITRKMFFNQKAGDNSDQ